MLHFLLRKKNKRPGWILLPGLIPWGSVLGPVLGVCFGRGFRAFVGREGALARQKLILVRLRGSNFCKLFSLKKNSKITSAIHLSNSLQHFTSEITSAKHFRKHSSKQSLLSKTNRKSRFSPVYCKKTNRKPRF